MTKKTQVDQLEAFKAEVERRSHPAARLFALLIDKDKPACDAFLADIEKNDQQLPIIVDAEGNVLDGRNRHLACLLLGKEVKSQTRDLKGAAAVAFVMSANIYRRHDDPGVLGIQTSKLIALLKAEKFPVPTQKASAAAAGISDRTLRHSQRLLEQAPALADEVEKESVSLNAARTLAGLPEGVEREEAINKVQQAGSKTKAKRIVKKTKKHKPLKLPGLTGAYATLLAMLDNIPELPGQLRNLHKLLDSQPIAPRHAQQLKSAIVKARKLNAEDLLAAYDAAIKQLDEIIRADTQPTVTTADATAPAAA